MEIREEAYTFILFNIETERKFNNKRWFNAKTGQGIAYSAVPCPVTFITVRHCP